MATRARDPMRRQRRQRPARAACLVAVGGLGLLVLAGCTGPTDSFKPVTDHGRTISDLFALTMVLSFLVVLMVAGLLAVIMVRFRARPEAGPDSTTEGNRRLEIAWTVAPVLLLVVLFILTVRTMQAVGDPPPNQLRVQVIGHQWWWEYHYPDLGVVTANELTLPVGRPVRLEITAADVIHSFWVPRLGWKMDAIPGKTNVMVFTLQQAGSFDGTCTEYCGAEHAWMRLLVIAKPGADFDAWAAGQKQNAVAPTDSITQAGQSAFLQNTCASCHAIRGTGANAAVGPDLTHFGSRTTLGAGVEANTPDNLRDWIRNAHAVKPGVLMPAFTGLSNDQIEALVKYLESLR